MSVTSVTYVTDHGSDPTRCGVNVVADIGLTASASPNYTYFDPARVGLAEIWYVDIQPLQPTSQWSYRSVWNPDTGVIRTFNPAGGEYGANEVVPVMRAHFYGLPS